MAIRKGGIPLTRSAQKKQVMTWLGISAEEYSKQYDKLRNRARNYERATGAPRVNVADLFAREARRQYYAERGIASEPSALYSAISSVTSASPGRALSTRAVDAAQSARKAEAEVRFGGVISNSKYSESFSAEVAELERSQGRPLSGTKYFEIAEKYARKLDAERKAVVAINQGIEDPFKRIFFSSK